jgi:hypothetical protein
LPSEQAQGEEGLSEVGAWWHLFKYLQTYFDSSSDAEVNPNPRNLNESTPNLKRFAQTSYRHSKLLAVLCHRPASNRVALVFE